ncbi:putative N-acyltransferase [Undibacterium sp. GrIS 1.2]|uniref:GNAT family N-acetyltransferase n=1 Tax=Undibacterium sp. GrIS 1.2 TaxID=3143933 RepID=UPI0033961141
MKIKIFEKISDVPKEQWDRIQSGYSCCYAYEFWDVIEQAKLNDFSYQYAIFYDEIDNPMAIASFYTITTDIAIFAPPALRNFLLKIRRLFPNFLKFKMLECGTPISLNKPFVASVAISEQEIVTSLDTMLNGLAKKQGHFLIVVRDFEPESAATGALFKQRGYHLVDSLATTYMTVSWSTPEKYLSSLKSYYRSKLQKHLKINQQQGIRHELHDEFDHLADTLCNQWLVVHNSASEYQREILTPEFYRGFSSKLGERSKVILFYRNDELIGHALLLMDRDTLRWLYFGRTEAVNDSLYIYVAHKVVETAINLGLKRIEMGLTTYSIKKDLGAYMSPIQFALRAPSAFINFFVGFYYPILNHTPEIQNKNIFKQI